MFARSTNITNVQGRISYCKNKENKEEVVGFHNTTSDEFWRLLAQENQARFLQSSNVHRPGARASEAREFTIGLPAHLNDHFAAMFLAAEVKRLLGVECVVAVHQKHNEKGELNTHAHIIVAERTLLPEPIVTEERRAERNYYYDADGKKCKKADAVKVTHKGEITQEASVQYFSNKSDFYNLKKIEPLIDSLAHHFSWEKFDINRHFPTRHIGKNNPKEDVVKAHNRLVSELNAFFDKREAEGFSSPKKAFCEATGVPARFGINRTDEVRELFERYRVGMSNQLSENEERRLKEKLAALRNYEAELKKDYLTAVEVLTVDKQDFVKAKVAEINQKNLEEKYQAKLDDTFLNRLQAVIQKVANAIKDVLRKLGIATDVEDSRERSPKQSVEKEDLE